MALEVGQKAPDFTGINQDGKEVSLQDFKGKKLILFFYPKDNTPGCTAAACNLRDNYSLLREKGFELLGVSPDDVKKHLKFIEKQSLPMDLIADTEKKLLELYEAWGLKKLYGKEYMGVLRTTYIIDEKGVIERVFAKVKTKTHTEQILETYE